MQLFDDARNVLKFQLQSIAHKYFYNFKPYKKRCPLLDLAKDHSLYISKLDKGQWCYTFN